MRRVLRLIMQKRVTDSPAGALGGQPHRPPSGSQGWRPVGLTGGSWLAGPVQRQCVLAYVQRVNRAVHVQVVTLVVPRIRVAGVQ
jgi:hypothetical protein